MPGTDLNFVYFRLAKASTLGNCIAPVDDLPIPQADGLVYVHKPKSLGLPEWGSRKQQMWLEYGINTKGVLPAKYLREVNLRLARAVKAVRSEPAGVPG